MFERILIRAPRPNDPASPLDLGAIIESAVFYGSTQVVLGASGLGQMVRSWGADGLVELLDSNFIQFRYQQNFAALQTRTSPDGKQRHQPVVFEIKPSAAPVGPEFLVGRVLEEVIGKRGKARRVTQQICRRLSIEHVDSALADRVSADLLQGDYLNPAIRRLISVRAPGFRLPEGARFEVGYDGDGFVVATDIDFAAVNDDFHRYVPVSQATISPAFLLAHFMLAREAMEDAAKLQADLVVDPAHSSIIALRVERALSDSARHIAEIRRFQEFVFDEGRAIREAVNDGNANIDNILKLLDRASKFRSWIQDQPADADLIRAYFRETTASTWVDALPTKVTRWLLFSSAGIGLDALGLGGLGTLLGVGLGGLDALIVDRVLKGWRPSHFVEDHMNAFVNRKSRKQTP